MAAPPPAPPEPDDEDPPAPPVAARPPLPVPPVAVAPPAPERPPPPPARPPPLRPAMASVPPLPGIPPVPGLPPVAWPLVPPLIAPPVPGCCPPLPRVPPVPDAPPVPVELPPVPTVDPPEPVEPPEAEASLDGSLADGEHAATKKPVRASPRIRIDRGHAFMSDSVGKRVARLTGARAPDRRRGTTRIRRKASDRRGIAIHPFTRGPARIHMTPTYISVAAQRQEIAESFFRPASRNKIVVAWQFQ